MTTEVSHVALAVAACTLLAVGPASPAEPGAAKPPVETPGFDPGALDRSADPCRDFYQFACGGWRAANPVPADQPAWSRFNELGDRNRKLLREVLEAAAPEDPARSPVRRQIGDYYAACVDEAGIEARGLAPLRPRLDRITTLESRADVAGLVAGLHLAGASPLFGFGADQDLKDTTRIIAIADRGGMGLPDRDYYLKDDPKSVELRGQYERHVARMLELAGDTPEVARSGAAAVLEIETALARGALDVVSRRDPNRLYHKTTVAELRALTPSFAWDRYLEGIGAPPLGELNVAEPDFFAAMEKLVAATDLPKLKAYLRWHALTAAAPFLPTAFVEENFAFFGRALTGAQELRPRWKRCADATGNALGEAVGRVFVEKAFSEAAKGRMKVMVEGIEGALGADIETLPWMSAATKRKALEKLLAVTNKVGYPDTWRDYGSLAVARGDALGNAQRAWAFELRRQLAKIGRPVDRAEWVIPPQTVNAGYNPPMNEIIFPAGILQPPFFDEAADDAVNYGAIGAAIGHELTHGFDDQGRQFAADGNLRDWWTEQDARAFEERTSCFVDQYGSYVAVEDVKVNGKLTLGENVADNGGLRMSYTALTKALAGKEPKPIDGFTPAQRFFLGWGQVWCSNQTPQFARLVAQTDPHSPGQHRVNGVVSNMPEFREAFSCPADAPMVRAQPCRVW